MAVLYSKEKGKLGTLTGSIINWSNQLSSNDPADLLNYQTLPAGYLRCDGSVYLAENFPELASILGVGSNCRYKKPDTTLLDNQFQVPDLSSKSTKTSFGANLGDYQDTYLLNDSEQEITKSGVGLEVSSNIGTTFEVQYQGNFFLPSQTIEITGQPGFARSTGNYTEETEVLHTAFQPHAHFHDGKRSRTASPTSEFSLFGRNAYKSKSTLCISSWADNTVQPLCSAAASKFVADLMPNRNKSNQCFTFLIGGPSQETYEYYGGCWFGCTYEDTKQCLVPGDIPILASDGTGVPTGSFYQFGCNTNGTQLGWPMYFEEGTAPPTGFCGNMSYVGSMTCKTGPTCNAGPSDCNAYNDYKQATGSAPPSHQKLGANYTPALVNQATQVPFDSQADNPAFAALNNTVTDVEEFGRDCIHKHFMPFEQDPHNFFVVTQPTYIPADEITSTIQIDVNEQNKADGYIQPFLVQEFLIKY